MKLIIQIPCYNEVETLPATLADLPRELEGFDSVAWLIVDDGSTDGTAEVARRGGVDHVVRFTRNRGLARAFEEGLSASLALGADVIVNTDADNQYAASCIPDLVAPILRGQADIVVGDRPIDTMAEFSWTKKRLQRLGSWLVRQMSGADLPDATSGFRAFSRDAALRLHVISEFTYTLETLLQAGHEKLALTHVPVRVNRATRPSRLFRTSRGYVARSLATLVRVYTMHQPLRVFVGTGLVAIAAGLILGGRYAVLALWLGEGKGHIQSVIVSGLLLNVGVLLCMMGLVTDTIRANRLLIERVLHRLRRLEVADRGRDRGEVAPPKDPPAGGPRQPSGPTRS